MVKAGDPKGSLLIQRVLGLGGKPRMPMGFAPLSKEKMELLEEWILAGGGIKAAEGVHWAYVPPVMPKVPAVSVPIANPIDSFIISRLAKGGLKPSPPASREVLLRRVTLDLTGLPPSLAEIDAFLADAKPGAYERVVDRLLGSAAYGEKQAQYWLDLARYADSDGYEADFLRTAYPYRDWVIKAFNRNLPFDQFTVEQLAGDMLPNATTEQRVATGFHRNTMINREGGVDHDEAMYEVILDRVATTSTVWLGSTMACARCHDHKYDPISQKDFFAMYAIFANNKFERGSGSPHVEPSISVMDEVTSKALITARFDLSRAEDRLVSASINLKVPDGTLPVKWQPADGIGTAASGSALTQSGGIWSAAGADVDKDEYAIDLNLPEGTTGIRLDALPDANLPGNGPGRSPNGNFMLGKLSISLAGKEIQYSAIADFSQEGFSVAGLNDEDPDSGWAIMPKFGAEHQLVLSFAGALTGPAKVTLQFQSKYPKHLIGKFRLSTTASPAPWTALAPPTRESLAENSPLLMNLRKQVDQAKVAIANLERNLPKALVLQERAGSQPLSAPLHIRGAYISKGPSVLAGVPKMFGKLPAGVRADRLGLARWLASPANPLTARVQVNRMWEQHFGKGLVETSEDFGTQGSKPSHPELLDWLASTFVANKWDLKAMHRLMVTSYTYRQSSNSTLALNQRDPANVLLARGPRFRLEAETIRDVALSVGGLLDRSIGGPSVYPIQPEGLWDSPYNGEKYTVSKGKDRYRRGLYTVIKRTNPYPSFTAFDAGSRESCTVRRFRTNTPLQALVLLNDPAFMEAARGLANRMDLAPGTLEQKLATGFRLCTGRKPRPEESLRLLTAFAALKARYELPNEIGLTPSQQAFTMIGNILLNLDETVTKS